MPEDRLIGRVREGDIVKLDATTGDAHRGGPRSVDDLVRANYSLHAVGHVADVLEEFQEAAAEVTRLIDDEQSGRRRHHELRDVDLAGAPQVQGQPYDADLEQRRGRILKPAHPFRIPAGQAHGTQFPAELLV